MKRNSFLERIIKRIKKYIHSIINTNNELDRSINKDQIQKSNNRVLDAPSARSIYKENELKAIEKFYLLLLVDHYNPTLGCTEISNSEIMKAANCKNNNTVVELINRLCDKKFIRKLVVPKGHTNRYLILKHLESSNSNLGNLSSQSSIVESDINKSPVIAEAVLEREVIKKILFESKIIGEASSDIIKRTEKINNKLNTYIKEE